MKIELAFNKLLGEWDALPSKYRNKYKSYRSKYINKSGYVGEPKMREMLLAAGKKRTEEDWKDW